MNYLIGEMDLHESADKQKINKLAESLHYQTVEISKKLSNSLKFMDNLRSSDPRQYGGEKEFKSFMKFVCKESSTLSKSLTEKLSQIQVLMNF